MVMAIMIGLGTFLIFNWAQSHMPIEEARTLAFCALVSFEWLMAFSARSDEHSVFKLGLFKNKVLTISIGGAVLLQLAVVYVPFLQAAFNTYPLNLRDWIIVISASGGLFMMEELRKIFWPKLYSFGKYQPMKWRR